MSRWAAIGICLSGAALTGCDTPVVDYAPHTHGADVVIPVDVSNEVPTGPAEAQCEPLAEVSGCDEGTYCETTAHLCVECVETIERCSEAGKRERCIRPESEGVGNLTGGFYEPYPCEPLHVCVPQGTTSTSCEYSLCTPGLARCATPTTAEICNTYGTAFEPDVCNDGWACVSGTCQPIRHNVMLIFDTSISMYDFSEGTGRPADADYVFPTCANDAMPMTRFDLAKTIFAENIVAAVGEFSHFALQRFPQYAMTGRVPTCMSGYYAATSGDVLTGDDGAFDTTQAGWFEANRQEAIVVPFSTQLGLDNTDALLSWLDFEEQLQATSQSCTAHIECPSQGCLLDLESGTNRCHVHAEPELRMGGNTPLGKSLFYAGEYFRRSVLIDGNPCTGDTDCPSAGYVCDAGVCRDPYANCRDNLIVLFTDGQENRFTDKDDFFSPQAQAKRLAFGLHCTEDNDCRGGAICIEAAGISYCVPPEDSIVDSPVLPGTGYDALSRPDGSPISIRTTVVDLRNDALGGANPNATIARWGGGTLVEVSGDDPDDMKAQLYEVMTPAFKCAAEEF